MSAKNQAEQIVVSRLDGADGDVDITVVAKSIVFTISDGDVDFVVGDKFTCTVSKNPPAVTVPAADSGNTGDGTISTPTLVGDLPDEELTIECTVAAAGAGTFKVTGEKSGVFISGNAQDLVTVGGEYTHVYQQIAAGDEIIAALYYLTAATAPPADKRDKMTAKAGKVSCSDPTDSGIIMLTWRDVSAG